MSIGPTYLIAVLLLLAFWGTILWCAITLVKSVQRIANSVDQIAKQNNNEDRRES